MSTIFTQPDFRRFTSGSPIASLGEIVFHGTITINNNFSTQQVLPVTFTDSPIFIGRLGRKIQEAFLTLKYITISSQKSPTFSDKHRAACFQVDLPVAAANTTTPIAIYFNTSVPKVNTFYKSIALFSVATAGQLDLDLFQVKEHNLSVYYDLDLNMVAPYTATGPVIALTNYFDPIDGLTNFNAALPGFDLKVNAVNHTASPITVNVYSYGSAYAYDWVQMLVRYKDWQGNIYNAGVFDDLTRIQTFPLGQQVLASISNPTQLAFGNVIFDPINFNSFYNSSYTYDVVLSASVDVFI